MMRIAVDARELTGHTTGVGRYLQRLLQEWGLARVPHRFTLYSPSPRLACPPGLDAEIVALPGTAGTRWEQVTLAGALRRDRPEVLLAPAYSAPLAATCPCVVAMHDVSFSAHPEWFGWREGTRRRLLARLSARAARLVVTGTAFSRDEIVRYLGVPRERIRVIPYGLGMAPAPPRQGGREPLVLFVGSIFNRRHVSELISGFRQFAGRDLTYRLEIVGANRTYPRQDLQSQTRTADRETVRVRDWVDDDELLRLYGQARVFAFLSEYEGFGFTPLEALASGATPVVLDTPVAREVLKAAAVYVPRPEPADVAAGLRRAFQPDEAARVAAAAPDVLSCYDWRETARQTLAALEEAAR
jgi:glycosyltransferase involved in cell wall biosynthesis